MLLGSGDRITKGKEEKRKKSRVDKEQKGLKMYIKGEEHKDERSK